MDFRFLNLSWFVLIGIFLICMLLANNGQRLIHKTPVHVILKALAHTAACAM